MRPDELNAGVFSFTNFGKTIFVRSMIYLSNTTDAQIAYVPRDTEIPAGTTLTFTMRNTVDMDVVVTALVIVMGLHRIFYNVALQLPADATPGEYQFELRGEGELLSTGLAVIRDDAVAVNEYNKVIQYEQYETN